jgi:hypothetical protein
VRTTAEETAALVSVASGGGARVDPEVYGELYGKGLVSGSKLTDAGKAHLCTIAKVMTHAPGKRTYVVIASIVRKGKNMKVGDEFEVSPAGTHVQRWLAEGRIEAR